MFIHINREELTHAITHRP